MVRKVRSEPSIVAHLPSMVFLPSVSCARASRRFAARFNSSLVTSFLVVRFFINPTGSSDTNLPSSGSYQRAGKKMTVERHGFRQANNEMIARAIDGRLTVTHAHLPGTSHRRRNQMMKLMSKSWFWFLSCGLGLLLSGLFYFFTIPGALLACARCNCHYSLTSPLPECRWPAIWGLLSEVSLSAGALAFLVGILLWRRSKPESR